MKPEFQRGSIVVVVAAIAVIVFLGLALMFLGYSIYKKGNSPQVGGSYTLIEANYVSGKEPPAVLTVPTQVQYQVQKGNAVSLQGGSLITSGLKPFPGAKITFSLENGNATVDGKSEVTVITDRDGMASVILSPEVEESKDRLHVNLFIDANLIGSSSDINEDEKYPKLFDVRK